MDKLLAIMGPTATGKTDMALNLARKFDGELISADSRQVYRFLDIGTGKMPDQLKIENSKLKIKKADGWWEIDGTKIWMYDVISPKRQYTVADYVKDAYKVLKDINVRKKLPIVVGGTGLYLKALLYGLPNLSIPIDYQLRQKIEKLSLNQLQNKLKAISFKKWQSLNYSDSQNPRRLIRAIELVVGQRNKKNVKSKSAENDFNILKLGLTASRRILYQRSDERVVKRVNAGMIEEARGLSDKGLSLSRMRALGLEYGVLADFLVGEIKSNKELITIMQGKIHAYVRRQLTWFKKEKNIDWFDVEMDNSRGKIEKLVSKWYDAS